MTFLEQFERALTRMLRSGSADPAEIVRWASERMLEGFHLGASAALKHARHSGAVRRGIAYAKRARSEKKQP